MIYGGTGAIVGFVAAAGMAWLVTTINETAFKPAIILGGLVLAIVGFIANRTDLLWKAQFDPSEGTFTKEKHHFFWIGIEWWGLLIFIGGFFL